MATTDDWLARRAALPDEADPICEACGNYKSWEDCDECGGEGETAPGELAAFDPLWYDEDDTDARGGRMSAAEATPDMAELERDYLTPVRQAINRALSAHETYGAGQCGPDYPRRREEELSAEWARLLHFVQLALRRREAALTEARATIAWYADEANHLAHWDTALGQAGWVDAEIELDRGERARAYLAAHGGAGGDDVR